MTSFQLRLPLAAWAAAIALGPLPASAAPPELACPAGTELRGAAPPEGTERYCARPDGVRHGPALAWDVDGRVSRGAYRNGARHGLWEENREGERAIGRYVDGVKEGPWHYEYEHWRVEEEWRDGALVRTREIRNPELEDLLVP